MPRACAARSVMAYCEALPRLASALTPGASTRHAAATLDQALTVVYRILFLLFAEARGAVPVWHELYRDAYTIEALTRQAGKANPRGLWAALQAISRLAHAGCKAADLEVTAFNGRLFSPRHAPLVERRRVPDAVVRDVLLSLATESTPQGLRRISYHDLGVEQLGSVYERVLEYEPRSRGISIALSRTSIDAQSHRQLLHAAIDHGIPRSPHLVAAGRRQDGRSDSRVARARSRHGQRRVSRGGLPVPRRSMREGVDRTGPMVSRRRQAFGSRRPQTPGRRAVSVRRRSQSHGRAAGAPVDVAHDAGRGPAAHVSRSPPRRRQQPPGREHHGPFPAGPPRRVRTTTSLPLFDDQLAEIVAHRVMPARLQLALTPSDSVEVVKGKERTLATLSAADGPMARWWLAADLWCAARLWPAALAAGSGTRPSDGCGGRMDGRRNWIADHAAACATSRVDARPRARSRRATAPFTGSWLFRKCSSTVTGGSHRTAALMPCSATRRGTWCAPTRDRRRIARRRRPATVGICGSFAIHACYALQGNGHANRYQLFLERALRLTKPGRTRRRHPAFRYRHRSGQRAAPATSARSNRDRHVVRIRQSASHLPDSSQHAVRPPLDGERGRTDTLTFRCALNDPEMLDAEARDAPSLTIARSRLESWSADLSIPEVPDETSLGILSGIATRVPTLGDTNGWNARFGRELNATDDRPHFVQLGDTRQPPLPIVGGKLLSPFQVHVDRAASGIPAAVAARLLGRNSFQRPRLAYRDVASATNKLTLIAAMLPAGTVSTHTVFVLKSITRRTFAMVFDGIAQQSRRELHRPAAGNDARDRGVDGTPAGAAAASRLPGV